MIFYKDAFKLFHDVLLKHYRDTEFDDCPEIKNYRLSKILWKQKVKGESVPRSLRIAGTFSFNSEIFNEILQRGTSFNKKTDLIIVAGLQYLGFSLPSEYDLEEIKPEQHSQLLFKLFLEGQGKKGLKILEKYPKLNVVNPNIEILPTKTSNLKTNDVVNSDFVESPTKTIKPSDKNDDENYENIIKVIREFYSDIRDRDFKQAYEYVTPKSYKRNIESFIMGYAWTVSISNLHVFSLKFRNSQECHCKIYFEERIDVLGAFRKIGLDYAIRKDALTFSKMLDDMRSLGLKTKYIPPILEQSEKGLEIWMIRVNQLLILNDRSIPLKTNSVSGRLRNLYQVKLVKVNKNWFIDSISSIEKVNL